MKILWIVNVIFPYPAQQLGIEPTVFGGWLNGLADNIVKHKNIELAIASVYNGSDIKEYNDGCCTYFIIPTKNNLKYDKKMEQYWRIINEKFKPDLVHIHGTEYPHALAYINACSEVKTVTSIQGLMNSYGKIYTANMSYKDIIKNITFRDIIRCDNIWQAQQKFLNRATYEREIIKKTGAIIGRTTWDYANVKAIKPDVVYYHGEETLRNSFYTKQWDSQQIEKYSIFVSQASYPIKGLHFLLEAIAILRNNYNNVKLYVAGNNILDKDKIKTTGYAKYLSKLISKYDIAQNIEFTGLLTEQEIMERMLKSNVFVLPSAIENSSNSLGEAMLLGMPCVATNTGGTMDMIEHSKEGFTYPYTEPAMCAEYISRFFEEEKLCINMGQTARERALTRHNREKNVSDTMEIYEDIVNERNLK